MNECIHYFDIVLWYCGKVELRVYRPGTGRTTSLTSIVHWETRQKNGRSEQRGATMMLYIRRTTAGSMH